MAKNPITNAQIIANLGGFGDFEEDSGGELDQTVTDYYQAGRLFPRKVPGTHTYSDLVLTRAYDPIIDAPLIDWVTGVVAGIRPDRVRPVIKRAIGPLGIPLGTFLHPNCRPKHIKVPNGKAGDSGVAMITVTLAVEGVL